MTPLPANAPNRSQYFRWVGTLTSAALLMYLIAKHWDEILAAFQQISLGRLLLALVLIIISRFAVSARWYMLLRATDVHISWGQTIRLTFAGLFASNFLPTTIGGDVVRLAGAVQFNMDGVVSAASLVVDRLVGMLGMALALSLGLGSLAAWFRASSVLRFDMYLAMFTTGGWMQKWWQKSMSTLRRFWVSISVWSRQPRSLLEALFFTGIHMLCLFGAIMVLLDDMGDPLSLREIGGLWSFVYFVTLLPISINGYGVQELSMVFVFSRIGGISNSSALTVAVLIRTVQMLASLPGAAFVPAIIAGTRYQDKQHAK